MLVFVYGTLRKAEPNHHWLEDSHFVGHFTTPARYSMIHLGAYPAVIAAGSTAITGEVYHVTPEVMAKLDLLEDFPNAYDRKHIPTPYGQAWMYLWIQGAEGHSIIKSGDWKQR